MFRTRAYTAFAITPRTPIVDWLADLDTRLARSNGFFAAHAVALDLSRVRLSPGAIAHLINNLAERNIRVLGISGVDPAIADSGLPPVLLGDCPPQAPVLPQATPIAPAAHPEKPTSLLVEDPVRSGQSVVFTEGDVTVLGSVGSGADIVAGGSIHVYGTLRGRAIAGINGNARARIFCHRVEAELLAIDSYYKTADEIEDGLRRGPAQAWLEGSTLRISAIY
jgi:septum site-determining protein MinC